MGSARPRSFQIGFKHCELPFFDSRVSQMGTIYGVTQQRQSPGTVPRCSGARDAENCAARGSNSRARFTARPVSDGGRTDPTLNGNRPTVRANGVQPAARLYSPVNVILSLNPLEDGNVCLIRSGRVFPA